MQHSQMVSTLLMAKAVPSEHSQFEHTFRIHVTESSVCTGTQRNNILAPA